jgi:hypothetical protein
MGVIKARVCGITAWVALAAVLISGCVSTSKGQRPQPTDHRAASVSDLTAGGVIVADSEADVPELAPGSIVLVRSQAERLIAEVNGGSGLLGADIDAMLSLPEGAPPMSYFIAAWISLGESPGSRTASGWMGTQDWTHAPTVVFPTAVLAMFAADALHHIDAELPPAAVSPSSAALGALTNTVPVAFVQQAGGPCSAVSDFFTKILTAVFDALRISPSSIKGLPPVVSLTVGFLAGLWNKAVSFAEGAIKGLLRELSAPVVSALQVALGALSVATVVLSYIRTWTLNVDLDPVVQDTDTYRFAIDAEPDITGTFLARAPQLADDWPSALRDCANVAGVKLPQLLAAGSVAEWTVEHNDNVITVGALANQVGADRTARLAFATGRETSEAAKGEPAFGSAIVQVRAPRKELQDLFDLVRGQIDSVRDRILDHIPSAELRAAAKAQVDAVITPTAAQLQADATEALGNVAALAGTGVVIVKYHQPSEPSPSPVPPPGDPGKSPDPALPAPSASPSLSAFCLHWAGYFAKGMEKGGGDWSYQEWYDGALRLAPPSLRSHLHTLITYVQAQETGDWETVRALEGRDGGEDHIAIAMGTIWRHCAMEAGATPPTK